MTGISEILVLVLLIACILILPRVLKGAPAKRKSRPVKIQKLRPVTRLGIVLSVLYPVFVFLYLKPWSTGSYIGLLSFGILPVVILWSLVWIFAGKKK